jgi:hypothetical protein
LVKIIARQRTADRIAAIARPAITANCVAVTWASPSRGSGSTTGCPTLTRAPEHPDLAADSVRCGNRISPQSHRVTQSVAALAEALPGGLLGRAQCRPDGRPGTAGRACDSHGVAQFLLGRIETLPGRDDPAEMAGISQALGRHGVASRPVSSFPFFNLIFHHRLTARRRTWGVIGPRG